MTRRTAIALLALALTLGSPQPGAATPREVSAGYNVFRNGAHVAVMTETFEARDDAYRIVSESSAAGVLALFERQPLRLVSSGQLTGSGLRPLYFEGGRSLSDRRRVQAEFDWQSGQLTLTHGGRTEVVSLAPDTQDRLSAMYQFMFQAPGRRQSVELAMTNGRKLSVHRYTVNSGVEIETPLGRMKTLHLVKQHGPAEDGAEIWLAPQYRHLPVRMLIQEDDGVRYEQIITRLEFK